MRRRTLTLLFPLLVAGCAAAAPERLLVEGDLSSSPARKLRPRTFLAAAIQAVSRFGAPAENRKRLERLVRIAAGRGAQVIVLPETAITGYMSTDLEKTWRVDGRPITPGLTGFSPRRAAETVPGPSSRLFGRLARQLGVYLTVPIVEFDPTRSRYFNTVLLMGPDGKMLLHYRKRNPWPFAERGWASRGERNVVVDTPLGHMSLIICFDINFEPPNLKKLKVDHLLYPIAWVDAPESPWFDENLPRIAHENRLNIIGANWTIPPGAMPGWHGYGKTRIIDRTGRILASAGRDELEEIVYARVPVASRSQARPTARLPDGSRDLPCGR